MADLFGLDIAGIVSDAFEDAGGLRPGVLTHFVSATRTVGELTGGTNPTETDHTFQGFVERRVPRRKGQVGGKPRNVVTILGGSVSPSVVPKINDRAVIDGVTYELFELMSSDPASAVYEFITEN